MLWIGITGPMGSGKSAVSSLLRAKGYPVLDADQIVHQILGPGTRAEVEILKTFGENLRSEGGVLDRRALGRVVFGDEKKLAQLEALIYPHLRVEVALRKKALLDKGHNAVFYDVPLLFEKGMREQFDHVIVVTASEELRKERLKLRSGLSDQEFAERSSKQMPAAEKERLASVVIHNQGTLDGLEKEIQRALKELKIPSPAVT